MLKKAPLRVNLEHHSPSHASSVSQMLPFLWRTFSFCNTFSHAVQMTKTTLATGCFQKINPRETIEARGKCGFEEPMTKNKYTQWEVPGESEDARSVRWGIWRVRLGREGENGFVQVGKAVKGHEKRSKRRVSDLLLLLPNVDNHRLSITTETGSKSQACRGQESRTGDVQQPCRTKEGGKWGGGHSSEQSPLGIFQTPRTGRTNLWRPLLESLNGKYRLDKLLVDGGQMRMITISTMAPEALFPGFNSPTGTLIESGDIAISQCKTMYTNWYSTGRRRSSEEITRKPHQEYNSSIRKTINATI